jgi:pimeloyl-ACP methyl ester carboxylesterase
MSAVVIDGALTHYEVLGRGKPLLFIHGWLGSWRYWLPTMQAISDKYRAYALDLWGFGDSDKSKLRYGVPDYVDLLDNFMTHLGIREAPLIGHALGASVALEYAVRYPDRVKKIMTVSLALTPDSMSRKLAGFADNSMIAKMLWRRQIAYEEVQQEAQKTNPAAITLSIQSAAQVDGKSHFQRLSQSPIMFLVVYGEKDDLIDPQPVRGLNSHWSNIRPIGLSGSRHFPMLDEATKFTRLLKDFLDIETDLSALELKEEWRRRTR